MSATTLHEFHHWLLGGSRAAAPFILLDTRLQPIPHFAAEVAVHLNEFDEEADRKWIHISTDLLLTLAADPAQRRLLGVADPCPNCPPTSPCGVRKVLTALSKRGHVVINHPLSFEAVPDHPLGFRASIGLPADEAARYDLIVNPARFQARCIAPLIADSFLEWDAGRSRDFAA